MFGKTNQNKKDWWAPVFRSLISYQNYKKIGNAIWLYLYFLVHADRKTGFLFRKLRTISKETNFPLSTIKKWLKVLKDCEYVVTKGNGRYLFIKVNNFKMLSEGPDLVFQKYQNRDFRSTRFGTSQTPSISKKTAQIKAKSQFFESFKEISLKKENIKNIVIYNEFKNFSFKRDFSSKEEFLALEIANALNDRKNLSFYLSIVKKYPEDFLFKILSKIKEIPLSKIKTTKGALFCYLLKKYETDKNYCN